MAIKAPHAHLYTSIKLEAANTKLGGGGRKSLYQALNLVAYIDMMTILVIFLLMTFSASGEILFVQKNIALPDAQNWTDLERAPVIGDQGRRHPGRLPGSHRRGVDEGLGHGRCQDPGAGRSARDLKEQLQATASLRGF